MKGSKEKQVRGFLDRQKAMILTEKSIEQRCLLVAMWKGFIVGLHITGVITFKEYEKYETEIKEFTERINQDEQKNNPNVDDSAITIKVASSC